MTDLLTECIIILNHEKENGILTEEAGNDILEFLVCACDHLYGGDAELIKEVHEIMEPVVWLRREMEQRNRELERDIQDLQESNKDLQESNKGLQESNKGLQESNENLQAKMQSGLTNLIHRLQEEDKNEEEVQNALMELFSLSAAEAKEMVKLHWKDQGKSGTHS